MTLRITWNEHEEAILLCALIKVLNHKLERKQAIKDVSKQLRELAQKTGIAIDDKFRNENGIRLQMYCLEYAYTNGKSGLRVDTGWYFDIVKIYREDYEKYMELLGDVMETSDSNKTEIIDFPSWIKKRNPEKADRILSSMKVLNILLLKNRTIRSNIVQITNIEEIESLISRIRRSNKGINLHSGSKKNDYLSALSEYRDYLQYFQDKDSEGVSGKVNTVTMTEASDSDSIGTNDESKSDDVQIVSFTKEQDYSYTRPQSLKYSGVHYDVRNWTQVYVQMVKCLFKDYPDKIYSLRGKSIRGKGRIDVANEIGSDAMIAPREIADDLFLETNESAKYIVKKIGMLLRLCDVDFNKVKIEYAPTNAQKRQLETMPQEVASKKANVQSSDGLSFYDWLTKTCGMAEGTGRSYDSAINTVSAFAKDHNIGNGTLRGITDVSIVSETVNSLLQTVEFVEINQRQHNRFRAALRKYMEYLGGDYYSVLAQQHSNHVSKLDSISDEEKLRIRKTLELPRFEYGFSEDGVELYRFRGSYSDVNDMSCSLDDEQLQLAIRNMGFKFDGKIYLIADEDIEAIKNNIQEYDNQDVSIIYYENLFDQFADSFFNAKIVSFEMLKCLLKKLFPKYKYKAAYFALVPESTNELELIKNDIVRVWGDDIQQTFDELEQKLPLIPVNKIKFTLSQHSEFVWDSVETYIQTKRFVADNTELSRLIKCVDEQCEATGLASLDKIPFDNLRSENSDLSETAFLTCFCKLVEDKYDRYARVLTRKGTSVDTYTAVRNFCNNKNRCYYNELEDVAKSVSGTIRTPDIVEAANSIMIRISADEFISDEQIDFDIDRIDSAIKTIVKNDFIGLKEITTFSTFPFCGYGWNLFLLESYCRRFSRKYRYDTRRANSSNSGAIVVKTCTLSYHQIMAHAVARSGRDLTKDEVFGYLTEIGYIERKRYGEIDSLIKDAEDIRERRE